MMRGVVLAAMLLAGAPAFADQRDTVLTCVGNMETDADWAQCRALIFAPCATDTVGDASHLACLESEKAGWLEKVDAERETLSAQLTSDSLGALTDLYGQWIAYVGQKCPAIGLQNAATSREAAQLGCEISETVGLASEFRTCLSGNSTAPYCVLQE